MDRRAFIRFGSMAAVGQTVQKVKSPPAVSIGGFNLSWTSEKGFSLTAEPLKVGGFTFPVGDWDWVATNIAQGAVSLIGGQIISALSAALFGAHQPDLGTLMKQQMNAFVSILKNTLDAEKLKDCQDRFAADVDLMTEYARTPHGAGGRLEHLIPDTAIQLSRLEGLGYPGYRTFLQFAGLRLVLLQDLAAKEKGEAIANFVAHQQKVKAYHDTMVTRIIQQTEPAALFGDPCFPDKCRYVNHWTFNESGTTLNHEFAGVVPFTKHSGGQFFADSADDIHKHNVMLDRYPEASATRFYDWLELRRQIMAESTDKGAFIVADMLTAKPQLLRKAAQRLSSRWSEIQPNSMTR